MPVVGKRRIVIDLDEDAPNTEAMVSVRFRPAAQPKNLLEFYGSLANVELIRPSQNDDLDQAAELRDLAS